MSDASVRQWLLTHTPLEPSLLEGPGFRALVAERVASVADGIESVYVNVLDQRPDEAERLIADISVPETWLFRYPNSFELLADVLRRRLANGSASLRMCSIGCAMGQEPYGMAITALGLERDGFRAGRLAFVASMANADESWAGVYVAGAPVPGPLPLFGVAMAFQRTRSLRQRRR